MTLYFENNVDKSEYRDLFDYLGARVEKSLVLIIEDEIEVSNILAEVVKMCDYEVIQIPNGKDAIELIIKNQIKPVLVLCDMNMPVMNGIDFIKQNIIKNLDLTICLISANSDNSRIIEALQLGVIDYISKPFEIDMLSEKLKLMVDIGKRKIQIKNQLRENLAVNNSLKLNNLLKVKNCQKKTSECK